MKKCFGSFCCLFIQIKNYNNIYERELLTIIHFILTIFRATVLLLKRTHVYGDTIILNLLPSKFDFLIVSYF